MTHVGKAIWSCLLSVCLFFLASHSAVAAPPPEAVRQAKAEAPLQVIGTIQEDSKFSDDKRIDGVTTQIRKATLLIEEIKKQPGDLKLTVGGTVEFYYWYYPPELQMVGSARVHVVKGDRIEVWLKQGEQGQPGWIPAFSGETLTLLEQAAERPEPIPPQSERTMQWWKQYGAWLFSGAALSLFLLYRLVWKGRKSGYGR